MNKKILLLFLLSSFLLSYADISISSSQTNTIAQYPNFIDQSYIGIGKITDNLDYSISALKTGNYYKNLIFRINGYSYYLGAYTEKARINIILNSSKIDYSILQNLTINNLTLIDYSNSGILGRFQIFVFHWNGSQYVNLPIADITLNNYNKTYSTYKITGINSSRDYVYIDITLIASDKWRLFDNSYVQISFSTLKWDYVISTAQTTTTTTTIPPTYTCNQSGFWFKCAQLRVLGYIPSFSQQIYSYVGKWVFNRSNATIRLNNLQYALIKIPYYDGMSPTFSDLYFRAFAYSNTTGCSGGIVDNGRCLIDLGEIPFAIYNYSPKEYAYIILRNTTLTGSAYQYFYMFFNSQNAGFSNQSIYNDFVIAKNVNYYSGNLNYNFVILKSPLVGNQQISFVNSWHSFYNDLTYNYLYWSYWNSYGGISGSYLKNYPASPNQFYFFHINLGNGIRRMYSYSLGISDPYFTLYNTTTTNLQYAVYMTLNNGVQINANISLISKPFITNVPITWEFIPSQIYISNQIENYLPYLNVKTINITNLISKQGNQAINSFIAFVLILLLAFIMKNEILAMLLFVLLFLFSLIFPNTLSLDVSTIGLILALLYLIWKFGKASG